MKYSIGIDIGGTNTDGVLIDDQAKIIVWHKTSTTDNVADGFATVLESLLAKSKVLPPDITRIHIGTTHATNALLQGNDLFKVGVLRLSGVSGLSIPTGYNWPEPLRKKILAQALQVQGGFYCDGRPFGLIDAASVEQVLEQLLQHGMESLAIIGMYSPINNEQEVEVAQFAAQILGPDFPITVSSALGGPGFLERENSAILNAALKKSLSRGFSDLARSVRAAGLQCPLLFTQNNGTVLSIEDALKYPVLTISAGPTNSFVGATKLAQLDDAVVADVGGTSTDVGIVLNGFARRSVGSSEIAGIPLNFQMPDVLSIALGGGSIIQFDQGRPVIGPASVGRHLKNMSQSFGGQHLTLTDIAIQKGILAIEGADPSRVACSSVQAEIVFEQILLTLDRLKGKIGGARKHVPLVLVGGGAGLLRNTRLADQFIIPEYAHVANAYGAALAEISGVVDSVVSLEKREEALEDLKQKAIREAISQGACKDKVRVVMQEIIPYHYMPNNLARVRIVVAGSR